MEKPRLFPQRKSRKKYRIHTVGVVHGIVGKESGKIVYSLVGKESLKAAHGREGKESKAAVHGNAKSRYDFSLEKIE